MGGRNIRDVGAFWVAVLTIGQMRYWSYRRVMCHGALLVTRQQSAGSRSGRLETAFRNLYKSCDVIRYMPIVPALASSGGSYLRGHGRAS